jgi:hypothetical protein
MPTFEGSSIERRMPSDAETQKRVKQLDAEQKAAATKSTAPIRIATVDC